MATVIDYSPLLIEMRRQIREFETSMNEREFKEAYEKALELYTEARLLIQIAKESHV